MSEHMPDPVTVPAVVEVPVEVPVDPAPAVDEAALAEVVERADVTAERGAGQD
jgi:hypothetical protein